MPKPKSTTDPARQRLKLIRDGLLSLHRILVRSERDIYDHDVQRITSSYQMLNLLLHDPFFEWLRELSTMIVQIDEVLDEPEITGEQAERFAGLAAALVAPAENGEGFQRRYYEAMQRDPDVVLAHGQFTKILASA